jgi:hypothetical protein
MARRRTNKRKKLEPEPEPPKEPPVEPKPEPPITEPLVKKLVPKQLEIEGNGVGYFRVTPDNVIEMQKGRLYLFKKDEQSALAKKTEYLWKPNIEVSIDIKIDKLLAEDKQFINVGGPTNHFADVNDNSNGRNYSVVFRLDRNGLGFKKETIHGVYDENHLTEDKMQLGRWYNIRYRQTVLSDKSLELRGWIDGKQFGVSIDDGTMTEDTSKTTPIIGKDNALYSPIKDAKQVWTSGAYSGIYIRLSGTAASFIKNPTIKEF